MQYTQDNDEYYPLTVRVGATSSWTSTLDSYIRNKQIIRCPNDSSTNWDSAAPPRKSSYFLNAYMPGTETFGKLPAMVNPANILDVAGSADENTSDHFHPTSRGGATNFAWNALQDETTEIALRRHQNGINAVFADGRCKWVQWSRLWNAGGATLENKLGTFYPGQ